MVAAIHDPRSLGIHAYVRRLAQAIAECGIGYRAASRPDPGEHCHFHLGNSTRSVVLIAARERRGFLATVHDVLPRTPALRPLHRLVLAPVSVRRAGRVIVHSRHAADLLTTAVGLDAARIEIVPFPAVPPAAGDRRSACRAVGLDPEGPPLFVLTGVLKQAKLVRETLSACAPLIASGRVRLLLAGAVVDDAVAADVEAVGAQLIANPEAAVYAQAVLAADAVVCARADSVGETNAPLLEAIGAGRPSLVTDVGSAPEVAADSACVVAPTVRGIRAGVEALLDAGERRQRAAAAAARAAELTWEASARRHIELLGELGLA